jgi:hypothetical protein
MSGTVPGAFPGQLLPPRAVAPPSNVAPVLQGGLDGETGGPSTTFPNSGTAGSQSIDPNANNFPGTGADGEPPSGSPNLGSSVKSAVLDPIWEVVSRGLLLFCGFALVFIALAAMLWQSKTVQVSAKSLAEAA